MKEKTSIPNANKTFRALRSMGYNLNSSIADLVDNSITDRVSAKNVQIIFELNEDYEIVLRIIDDGKGMSPERLEEGMRVGSEESYSEGDLGSYGMGMKTASLSHANILTVISKRSDTEISGFSWNMGHVKQAKSWSLLELETEDIEPRLKKEKLALQDQGTIVFWDELFLLNSEYNAIVSDRLAANYLFRKTEELKLHLRMVFHRFIDPESEIFNGLSISVNDEKLKPWDPFCRKQKGTQTLNLKHELSHKYLKEYEQPVLIRAYVLPNKDNFSSEKAWKEAKGLLTWNDGQGYYIYRANRLIRFGGWHATKAKDEHDKLARISIDIHTDLDDEFSLTVNKNKVEFPEQLFQHLKKKVNPLVIRNAKAEYNKRPVQQVVKNRVRESSKIENFTKDLMEESNIGTDFGKKENASDVVVTNPTGSWLANKLNEFLKYGEEKDFEIVSAHIEDGQLWKIVCDPNNNFKVIINSSHPFYSRMYKKGSNKDVSEAMDALLFSLAFSELYNKNNQNAQLFETFKTICSNALERLTTEKII